MKTVKFKDLPEKVRDFLEREYSFVLKHHTKLDWLHNLPDWYKATDELNTLRGDLYVKIQGGGW